VTLVSQLQGVFLFLSQGTASIESSLQVESRNLAYKIDVGFMIDCTNEYDTSEYVHTRVATQICRRSSLQTQTPSGVFNKYFDSSSGQAII
jgi:hypothetical protein